MEQLGIGKLKMEQLGISRLGRMEQLGIDKLEMEQLGIGRLENSGGKAQEHIEVSSRNHVRTGAFGIYAVASSIHQ